MCQPRPASFSRGLLDHSEERGPGEVNLSRLRRWRESASGFWRSAARVEPAIDGHSVSNTSALKKKLCVNGL